jgi:excisionase family DNA binding protein
MQDLYILTKSDLREIIAETFRNELQNFKPVQTTQPDALITRKETAKLLGISLPTLHTYTNEGKVQSYRVGRKVLYKQSEVIEGLHKTK